jgi:leader peptidase (prepilin peptidase)/N-methyltransferase
MIATLPSLSPVLPGTPSSGLISLQVPQQVTEQVTEHASGALSALWSALWSTLSAPFSSALSLLVPAELLQLLSQLFTAQGNLSAALAWSFIGVVVGSFLNVVIHRLPVMMQRETENFIALDNNEPAPHTSRYNLILPRSACPSCGHPLSVADNLPLLSYVWLKGRCRYCRAPISLRYPLVEMLTAVLSAVVVWQLGSELRGMAALLLVWTLIALTFIDIDTQMLPDDLTLPLVWLGLLVNLHGSFVPLSDAVIGAAAGYLSLWAVYWLFRFATGKEGIGYGDFKLLAALGAWLGWMMLPFIVLLSSAMGALVGIVMILLRRHQREKPIPFGPFLAVAGLIALFYAETLLQLWLA